eukprot:2284262-Prorocentrum_lima.AAC.1
MGLSAAAEPGGAGGGTLESEGTIAAKVCDNMLPRSWPKGGGEMEGQRQECHPGGRSAIGGVRV